MENKNSAMVMTVIFVLTLRCDLGDTGNVSVRQGDMLRNAVVVAEGMGRVTLSVSDKDSSPPLVESKNLAEQTDHYSDMTFTVFL